MKCDEDRFRDIKKVLIEIPGVVGVGLGRMNESSVIVVMLEKDDEVVRARIREFLRDIPYIIKVTGKFRVYDR